MKKNLITAITLSVFALVCALLLAFVNQVTQGPKAEMEKRNIQNSISELVGDSDFDTKYTVTESIDVAYLDPLYSADTVNACYIVKEGEVSKFYVFVIEETGFAGAFKMMIVVNENGEIHNSKVLSQVETKIIDKEWGVTSVMNGKDTINSDIFDVKSGTTFTYSAMYRCYNTALYFAHQLMEGEHD